LYRCANFFANKRAKITGVISPQLNSSFGGNHCG
jgi:hypothetical protein